MINPEDEAEYQEFRQQFLATFDEAVRKKTSIVDFAVEIMTGAIMKEKVYVAIASMMLEHSTTLRGQDKMVLLERFLEEARSANPDISVVQAALQLIVNGLIIHQEG